MHVEVHGFGFAVPCCAMPCYGGHTFLDRAERKGGREGGVEPNENIWIDKIEVEPNTTTKSNNPVENSFSDC